MPLKGGRRYRYCVSRPLITESRTSPSTGSRIPATAIEQLVLEQVRRFLSDPASVFDAVSARVTEPAEQKRLADREGELVAGWDELTSSSSTMPPTRCR